MSDGFWLGLAMAYVLGFVAIRVWAYRRFGSLPEVGLTLVSVFWPALVVVGLLRSALGLCFGSDGR